MPAALDRVETFGTVDLKDALVVVAFPTTGSASSIAAQFLARQLTLPLVGHLPLEEGAHLAAVEGGRITGLIRIYGGDVVCRLQGKCPRLYIVTTEVPVPKELTPKIAGILAGWAKGARLLLVLEGVQRDEADTEPDVWCAAGEPDVLKELAATKTKPMERALIGGILGPLVRAGQGVVPVGALIVEASKDHPDGRAAVELLEALGRIVPDVVMDPKPLLREAMALEGEIKQAQRSVEPPETEPPTSFV
jgi:uncharacterized protein